VRKPDDALFERLAELPRFELLAFVDLPSSPNLTNRGWEAVAKLPLLWFTLVDSKTAPDALRVLTAKGEGSRTVPALEFLGCKELTDQSLLELSRRPTEVKFLSFSGIDLTDEGVKHLAEVKSLKTLLLRRTKVTEEGARALSAERPDMKITWDGKQFGTKK
jgi:hypothetical protein